MTSVRIALANQRAATTPEESVELAVAAIREAGAQQARVLCFPECFVPGYRWPDTTLPAPDPVFLAHARAAVADAAKEAAVTVKLGTERCTDRGLQISACVINADGTIAGWQDKGQLDPDEELQYPAFGADRHVFTAGPLTFGVVICHEGWRYPETVRWAVRRGAQVVFHPHASRAEPGSYAPPRLAIRQARFTKKPSCVGPQRTRATSRRSTMRARAPARRRRSRGRTEPCSARNRTGLMVCCWPTWI